MTTPLVLSYGAYCAILLFWAAFVGVPALARRIRPDAAPENVDALMIRVRIGFLINGLILGAAGIVILRADIPYWAPMGVLELVFAVAMLAVALIGAR